MAKAYGAEPHSRSLLSISLFDGHNAFFSTDSHEIACFDGAQEIGDGHDGRNAVFACNDDSVRKRAALFRENGGSEKEERCPADICGNGGDDFSMPKGGSVFLEVANDADACADAAGTRGKAAELVLTRAWVDAAAGIGMARKRRRKCLCRQESVMACAAEGNAKPSIGEGLEIMEPLPDFIKREKEDVIRLREDLLFDHDWGAVEEKVAESA